MKRLLLLGTVAVLGLYFSPKLLSSNNDDSASASRIYSASRDIEGIGLATDTVKKEFSDPVYNYVFEAPKIDLPFMKTLPLQEVKKQEAPAQITEAKTPSSSGAKSKKAVTSSGAVRSSTTRYMHRGEIFTPVKKKELPVNLGIFALR